MILNFVFPNRLHESSLGTSLDSSSIECQVFRCAKIAHELVQSVTYVITVDLLNRVRGLEAALVRIQL